MVYSKTKFFWLVFFVFIASFFVGYFGFRFFLEAPQKDEPEPVSANVTQSVLEEAEPLNSSDEVDLLNILVMGYGGARHDGGYLTDVIKVISYNPKEERIVIISIPRDLWVSLPIRSDQSKYFKINAAYAIGMDDRGYPLKQPIYKGKSGAARMTEEAVEDVIGVDIDYYVAIDFDGFKDSIDILGGIKVNVPVAFDDYFYPVKGLENELCGKSPEEVEKVHELYSGFQLEKQFECRYEHLHFDAGMNEMDGETALKYVRSRHSDTHGGDFARGQRQLSLFVGLKNRALTLGALDDLPEFSEQFSKALTTDVDIHAVGEIISGAVGLEEIEILSIYLTDENVLSEDRSSDGQYILTSKEGIGKWEEVQNYVNERL